MMVSQTRIPIAEFFNIVDSGGGKSLRFKDKKSFNKLFEKVLNQGDCKKKLNELLAEIGKLGEAGLN